MCSGERVTYATLQNEVTCCTQSECKLHNHHAKTQILPPELNRIDEDIFHDTSRWERPLDVKQQRIHDTVSLIDGKKTATFDMRTPNAASRR